MILTQQQYLSHSVAACLEARREAAVLVILKQAFSTQFMSRYLAAFLCKYQLVKGYSRAGVAALAKGATLRLVPTHPCRPEYDIYRCWVNRVYNTQE